MQKALAARWKIITGGTFWWVCQLLLKYIDVWDRAEFIIKKAASIKDNMPEFAAIISSPWSPGIVLIIGFSLVFIERYKQKPTGSKFFQKPKSLIEIKGHPINTGDLEILAKLTPFNSSQMECVFASTITDPLQQCSYSIVDLKQWSTLDNKYFNREEKLPNIPSQAIGLIEGRAKPKKPILSRQNQRFYFHGFGLLNSTVYRARRDTIWTLTINASSGLQVITQKEIHFRCVGEKDFKLGDTIEELVNPTQPS